MQNCYFWVKEQVLSFPLATHAHVAGAAGTRVILAEALSLRVSLVIDRSILNGNEKGRHPNGNGLNYRCKCTSKISRIETQRFVVTERSDVKVIFLTVCK